MDENTPKHFLKAAFKIHTLVQYPQDHHLALGITAEKHHVFVARGGHQTGA